MAYYETRRNASRRLCAAPRSVGAAMSVRETNVTRRNASRRLCAARLAKGKQIESCVGAAMSVRETNQTTKNKYIGE